MFGDEVVTEAAQLDSMMKSGGVRKYIGCSEAMLHQKFPVRHFVEFNCFYSPFMDARIFIVAHLNRIQSFQLQ